LGIHENAEGNYEKDASIEKPGWTASYRYQYQWE